MTTALAVPQRCGMCSGYGCLVAWVHYPPPKSMPRTYMNGPSMFGRTVRCPACWAATLAHIAWISASRKLREVTCG